MARAVVGITLVEPVLPIRRPFDRDPRRPERRQPLDNLLNLTLPFRRGYVADTRVDESCPGLSKCGVPTMSNAGLSWAWAATGAAIALKRAAKAIRFFIEAPVIG